MKAQNIQVSIVGDREKLRVWNASFEFKGLPPLLRDDSGRVDANLRKYIERKIAEALASLDFKFTDPQPPVTPEEVEYTETLVPRLEAYLAKKTP